jgi:glycerol-1-phosphate dehydrogenase [NAD(P)+]
MLIKDIITKFDIPIQEILIASNLTNNCFSLLSKIGLADKKILIVSDQNTYPIAGKNIYDSLTSSKDCQSLILQNPNADEIDVLQIINQSQNKNLIIAVGSGTINDLCKIASFRLKIPYVVFGTAPSMNGYASSNASICVGGRKTSLPAQLATAIYLDLNVLANSPLRLIKAGIGDSICFSTCHFDWLLSHLVLNTIYSQIPFDLLHSNYQKLINFSKITDPNFINTLSETLIISGLGMYICEGSFPASQAEHLIAHYIEIKYPKIAEKSYHGEQIAVNTIRVLEVQEQILSLEKLKIKPSNIEESDLKKVFNNKMAKYFYNEIKDKFIDQNLLIKINHKLDKNWTEIKIKLQQFYINKAELLNLYQKFSLPKTASQIQIDDDIYCEAIDNAHLIRNRFTSLDLVKLIQ